MRFDPEKLGRRYYPFSLTKLQEELEKVSTEIEVIRDALTVLNKLRNIDKYRDNYIAQKTIDALCGYIQMYLNKKLMKLQSLENALTKRMIEAGVS